MEVEIGQVKFAEHTHVSADVALKNRRFGLFLWRVANGFIFLFFIYANYLMRSVQATWPPEGATRPDVTIPLIVSALLLLSGIPASRALSAIRRDDVPGLRRYVWITVAIGVMFVLGILFTMLRLPWSGPYSSIVNTMNGFHIAHALIGLLLFGYVLWRAGQGAYNAINHWGVEATVVFWHFVDLMWVFFFVVIYLI